MTHKLLTVGCLLAASASADADQNSSQRWTTLLTQVNDLLSEGRAEESIQRLAAAIDAARRSGHTGSMMARALNDLGSLYQDAYRLKEAERCYVDAILILEAHGGFDHPHRGLRKPGELRLRQARYTEAERLFRHAEKLASANGDRTALPVIYQGLADVSMKTRRYADAKRFAEQSILHASPDSEAGANALFLLGRIVVEQGKTTEAESLLRRALDGWRTSVGSSHPSYASGLAGLAVLLSERRPSDSERLFREALQIAEAYFGRLHPYYAQIMVQYSTHLRSCGRREEADNLRRSAEKILSEQSLRNSIGFTVDVQALRAP